MILYPQVPSARQALESEKAIGDVSAPSLSQSLLDSLDFTSSGGSRATILDLRSVRDTVTSVAASHGFPGRPVTARTVPALDADLTRAFCRSTELSVGEGSLPGLWVFMCAILLRDVVNWRWGGEAIVDRFRAGRRNTFYRYWYRGLVLRDDDNHADPYWLIGKLGEDNLVQIAERPYLAGNRDIARAMAKALVGRFDSDVVPQQLLVRDAMARANRAGAILAVRTFRGEAADHFAKQIVEASVSALKRTA